MRLHYVVTVAVSVVLLAGCAAGGDTSAEVEEGEAVEAATTTSVDLPPEILVDVSGTPEDYPLQDGLFTVLDGVYLVAVEAGLPLEQPVLDLGLGMEEEAEANGWVVWWRALLADESEVDLTTYVSTERATTDATHLREFQAPFDGEGQVVQCRNMVFVILPGDEAEADLAVGWAAALQVGLEAAYGPC